jgi:hypothetical protein
MQSRFLHHYYSVQTSQCTFTKKKSTAYSYLKSTASKLIGTTMIQIISWGSRMMQKKKTGAASFLKKPPSKLVHLHIPKLRRLYIIYWGIGTHPSIPWVPMLSSNLHGVWRRQRENYQWWDQAFHRAPLIWLTSLHLGNGCSTTASGDSRNLCHVSSLDHLLKIYNPSNGLQVTNSVYYSQNSSDTVGHLFANTG